MYSLVLLDTSICYQRDCISETTEVKAMTVLCQVDQVDGGKARVKTCDGATVSVELLNGNTAFSTPYVEFQGLVTSATSLREESRTDFGTTFGAPSFSCASGHRFA